ncbi:MAG: CYTH domain-containing protein [Coprobacillus sp.]|nr:CYTH domain-containing protein [Coprobacillus sp.]
MPEAKEIETRTFLTEQQYINITASFLRNDSHQEFFDVVNYYIDDSQYTLEENGCFLRVRNCKNTIELTLKKRVSETENIEVTDIISETDFSLLVNGHILPPGDVSSALSEAGLNKLTFIKVGEMETKRLEIIKEDYKIILDSNKYNEKSDYDLEVEAISPELASETLEKLAGEYHFKISKHYKSKYLRAVHS